MTTAKYIIFFILMVSLPLCYAGDTLSVTFLDVGQGDSCVVRTPGNKTVLIDAGDLASGWNVLRYLNNAGIRKLDALVITHPHADHAGGVFFILRQMDVAAVYDNGCDVDAIDDDFYRSYTRLVRRYVGYKPLAQGRVFAIGGVRFDVLWPPSGDEGCANPGSIVVRLKWGKFACLCMADADVTVERAIMEKYKRLSSDVLKVGHHGGKDTCSADFLKRVEPEIAVMSVNESARPQYPDIQTLARLKASGCRLLRTDTDGIITIEADVEGAMHIKTKKVSIYAEKI